MGNRNLSIYFTWSNGIMSICNSSDKGHAWDKPNILSKSTISKNALEKMHSVYEADWLSIISSNTSKLRTYCKFKTSFCKENYVDFFHRVARSSLTDYVKVPIVLGLKRVAIQFHVFLLKIEFVKFVMLI